jgi:glutathione S-transferase
MTITLYGWGPMFGAPGPSPTVMKCDMQLQMLGLDFARETADLESVSKHKAPYVRDGEELIQDSTFIRFYFEKKLGKDLDRGLSEAERGTAWSVERMLEDRLHYIMVHERWVEDTNFKRGPAQFFAPLPEAVRGSVIEQARNEVRSMLHRHGIGRHSRAERMELAARDLAAFARLLGDKPFMFGAAPTAVDAAAFGVIRSCASRFFDTQLSDIIAQHENLDPYLRRIEAGFFASPRWASAA